MSEINGSSAKDKLSEDHFLVIWSLSIFLEFSQKKILTLDPETDLNIK